MPNKDCNLQDKKELDYLEELKAKGIDGSTMLKDTEAYDEAGMFRVGNIRIDKFNVPQEAKDILQKLITEGNYYVEQRRGTINWEKNAELAKEIGTSIHLKPGQTLNAEEMENLSNAVAGLSLRATEASQKAELNPTDENIAKSVAARTELNIALASLSGAKTEAARALSIQRKLIEAIDSGNARLIKQAIKISEGRLSNEEIAAMVAKLPADDVFAQYRFLQGLRKPKWGEYVMELWYNSVLSGPLTHVRNLVSNTAYSAWLLATHPPAVFYDVLRSAVTKNDRSIYMGEMPGMISSGIGGIVDGFKKGLFVLQHGFTMNDAVALEFRKPEVIKDIKAGKITIPTGTVLNLPRRLLVFSDSISRSMLMEAELYGRSYRIAKNEGLKGVKFEQRMAELRTNPTEDMLKGAREYAARGVFQQESGDGLKKLAGLRNLGEKQLGGLQPVAFVMPFVQTPYNLFRVGFRASPFGFFGKSSDPRQSARDFSNAILGSLVMLGMIMYGLSGHISGSGPSDKNKRAALYRIGWQPNSIKIGNKWYSYQNLTPINTVLGLVGNLVDSYVYDGISPDTQGVSAIAFGYLKTQVSQSFLSGINGLVSALTGDEYQQQSFLNRFATSFVPQVWQQSQRLIDPTYYSVTSLPEAFQNALGINQNLAIKYDAFGNKIERQRATGLPLFPSTEKISPLEKKLIDIGVDAITMPPNKIGRRKMTEQEYAEFSQRAGKLLEQRLSDDNILPPNTPTQKAQDIVDEQRTKVYKEVRNSMFPDISDNTPFTYEDNSVENPNSIVDMVSLYAKAIGTDPVTAFERIFTGQKIIRVDNNTVFVERMSLADSEKVKQELGSVGDMKLDHTIPLELGGSNDRNNLKLVPNDVWASYTPVENHLGKLLRDGKIKKRDAQKMIKDFKDGKITAKEILDIK